MMITDNLNNDISNAPNWLKESISIKPSERSINDKDGKIISNINSSILKYRFLKGNKVDESAEFFSSSHLLVKKRF